MACTIDATVGGGGANSYASIPAADAYHEAHLEFATWDALDVDQKCRALQQATTALDARIRWCGFPASSGQALAWPRYGAVGRNGYIIGSGSIPVEVVRATAELARRLAVRSLTVDGTLGAPAGEFKTIKAGPVELEYNVAGLAAAVTLDDDVFADDVFYMLEGLGRLRTRGGVGSIALRRV